MDTRLLTGLAVVFAIVFAASAAQAQNDQTVVIGMGGGGYTSDSDGVRGDRDLVMSHLYVEWYAFDTLGIGFRRTVMLEVGIGLLAFGGFETFSVQTNMITANWVAFGEKSYTRVGLVGGVGTAEYEYDGALPLFGFDRHVKSSGLAALAGVYLDWGADGFGARLGYDYIATELDDVDIAGVGTRTPDATGAGPYLDLRWAF